MNYITTHQKPPLSFPSVSGSIVTFNSQYAGLPLKSHTVEVVATQSGSGTPSPNNVRTINGYSAINIGATGKNFAPINARTQTTSGTTITVDDDGVATVSNTGTASHFFEYYRGNFNFPKGTYRITAWVNGEEYTQSGIINSPYRIYFSMTNGGTVNAGNTFTVNHDTGMWIIYIQTKNGYTYNNDEVKIQIELGTVPTEWQKFGKLVTVQIGSTVYGGEYDARTGVLTVTHGFVTYDSNNVPYMQMATISGGVKNRVFIRQSGVSQDVSGVPDMLCNIAEPVEVNAQYTGSEGISIRVNANVNNQGFYIYDEDIQTLTEWQDYINNNSITVVYPLATPQTIQLPPCPIETTGVGVQNIWADTGDTTLQYPKFG